MNDGRPSFALREWRRLIVRPQVLAVLGVIVAILVLVGPFGTDDRMTPALRTLYWLCVVCSTYAAGALCSDALRQSLAHRIDPSAMVAVTVLLTGCVVTAIVLVCDGLFMGLSPVHGEFPGIAGTIFVVATLVTVLIRIAAAQRAGAAQATVTPAAPPPLLARLPFDKRGPLLAISVEDHYVRIRTTKGEEMVLLRLSDAIGQVGDTPGLQVHRSHWVALAAVAAVRRSGDRAILTLTDGSEIPVSRRYLPDIRKAGLLPA